MTKINNTYFELPKNFYQQVEPAKLEKPHLISFNKKLANELGFDFKKYSDNELTNIFSGQVKLEGSIPIAQAYAGHQFGHAVPELGDGRAHLLGEISGHDIQLKGSGQTKFSRQGDGKSALGPVLREYLISEAMNTLGVPTTRALSAINTGEKVYRMEGPEPGGIFTRVASSHLRVGTFEYFSFQGDLESIKVLLDYTLKRHYPNYLTLKSYKEKSLGLLKELIERQSDLVAKWSALGFIHGVMNTDNFSLAGITIDYGPCAFMDEFKFDKTFSSIDRHGRYSFFNQVPIAKWNILRLADCLLPLIHSNQEEAIKIIEDNIIPQMNKFDEKRMISLAKKLGIEDFKKSDESLVMSFLKYLEKYTLDFTLSFRNLKKLYSGDKTHYNDGPELDAFIHSWKQRVSNIDQLNLINPIYIPRNHLVQKTIDRAYQGDYSYFKKFQEVLARPFDETPELAEFSLAPKEEEKVQETFCGT